MTATMLMAAAVAVLMVSQVAGHGQSVSSFEGRWRLADRGLTLLPVVDDLIIRGTESNGTFSIEQRLPDGVRWVRYSIARHLSAGGRALPFNRAFPNVATWRQHHKLVLQTGAAVRIEAGSVTGYEEVWTMSGDDVLTVDISTRAFGGVPRTLRLSYGRVHRPALTSGQNLVENAGADSGVISWWHSGEAAVELCEGDPCFTIRNSGTFHQTIPLPREIEGRYLVIIGSGLSERVNTDGAITGLPTLYALVTGADGSRITAHLQGMLARPGGPNQWVTMSGVFQMPDDADVLSLQLNQASKQGVPQIGSAARFDNLGVFAFATEQEAKAFVSSWRGR